MTSELAVNLLHTYNKTIIVFINRAMNIRTCLLAFTIMVSSPGLFAQKPDTLIKKLDSLSIRKDSSAPQTNNINPQAYNEHTRITPAAYFILLADDFKQGITKPFHMKGKDWRNLGIFVAVTGALHLADEPVQQTAIKLRTNNYTVRNVSSYVTRFGGLYEAYVLIGLGAYGFIFHNVKMQTTTLLATQSYIISAVYSDILKRIFGRQRPIYTDPVTHEAEPKFYGPFNKPRDAEGRKIDVLSFPSGHTIAAFSAATVFAMEYKDKPWVSVLAYGAASLIGLSRISENKHWITDVFAGAAVGYLSGRLVVNNYHRYSKLKAPGQKKNSLSFNLQYNYGTIMPGVVYRFR
jgi:membrane-associated phospholipid phosphatase